MPPWPGEVAANQVGRQAELHLVAGVLLPHRHLQAGLGQGQGGQM